MARTNKTTRRTCRQVDSSISLPTASPRKAQTMIDTPRRTRLLCDAHHTAGKMPRKELFKAYGISESTGYRILKSNSMRRSEKIYNRGRKRVLASHECDAIEVAENASFRNGTATHFVNAKALGLANGSERAIQRNMAEYGVGTYMAQQKKFISQPSIDKREIWGFERRYWHEDDFKRYRYSDECHFACGLQRQARVHRRRGTKARNTPQKQQFRLK